MRSRRARAFTLLEMLVVLVLIAIIVALAVPALKSAHRRMKTAGCLSNLRQLQLAHASYAVDHDGYFIDVGLSHGGIGNEDIAWINTLQDYYDHELAVQSPLDRSPHWPNDRGGRGIPVPGTADTLRRTSYGFNNFLSRSYSPAAAFDASLVTDRLGKVTDHASTVSFLVMAFEGDFAGSDHPHVESWWVGDSQPNYPPRAAAEHLQINAVHGKPATWTAKSNFAFLDGHVETLEFARVFHNHETNRFDPAVSNHFLIRMALAEAGADVENPE